MRVLELDANLLDEFSDALWLEDGLSRNTLDSYRNDLRLFSEWLRKRNQDNRVLTEATHSDLLEFLASRVSAKIKAMIETLYSCGLRVSELINLRYSQVSMDMGVLRVTGKGRKERLAPLGEESLDWLSRYTKQARPMLLDGIVTDTIFVTARGAAMTRQAFWYLIKRYAQLVGSISNYHHIHCGMHLPLTC